MQMLNAKHLHILLQISALKIVTLKLRYLGKNE